MAAKFVDNNKDDARRMLRIADMVEEPRKMLMPIKGYEKVPLVSLEEAVEPLVPFVPDVRRMAWTAKRKCEEPADGLTCDESASIMLYSMEWEPHKECLNFVLNAALRAPDRRNLAAWLLYLRLILTALGRLRSVSRTVYRGVKSDLLKDYPKEKKFVWWGFSSCTRSVEVLNAEQFLGKTGYRTLFNINCYSGKNIRNHSYFEREDEILLLPARQFKVASLLNPGNNLHIIQIDEIEPAYPLLEPLPSITFYVAPSNKPPSTSEHVSAVKKKTSSEVSYNDSDFGTSYAQKNKCRYGGECWDIDDETHTQNFQHPPYCQQGGSCRDMAGDHLKQFRHVPLCKKGIKCMEFQKSVKTHCDSLRHCQIRCPYGNSCIKFHDKTHIKEEYHPFSQTCPLTPFHCPAYATLSEAADTRTVPDNIQQHCLDFAHVCRFGRNCLNNTPLHQRKSIHIARCLCPYDGKCNKIKQDEHLNSFTHKNVADIRRVCEYAHKCVELQDINHIGRFRHARSHEESGIVRYYGLNSDINFVQNQLDSIHRINNYIKDQKWKPLPSGDVPRQILDWFRTVRPVHRCNPIIFESILLHGHVMSRDYMENLKIPKFVATSVMQHSRVLIIENLHIPQYAQHAKEYIIAVVTAEFDKHNFPPPETATGGLAPPPLPSTRLSSADHTKGIKTKENILSKTISPNDLDALKNKAIEIAQASIKLHTNPAGIGHAPDKELGTHKRVFSVLGPHLGHYYGDVFIVFKREILHHPDADYSMLAATTFGQSGNAYKWRPWLGTAPTDLNERIKQYHNSKLHASIPGHEYAIALELMAITSLESKLKSMDINIDTIIDRWLKIDSHKSIEAHLPQLIPLDYIDYIYIPKNIFDSLNQQTRRAIDAVFKHRIDITPHNGCTGDSSGPFGPQPTSSERADYQKYVIGELLKRCKEDVQNPPARPIEGAIITIPASNFNESFVLPLTISQARELYRVQHKQDPHDDIAYIYWQAINGDMMLVLSNEKIETDETKKQPNLRCLLCYIAPKSHSSYDYNYHEQTTYLNRGEPFQHHAFVKNNQYKAHSNTFHIGSNTDDFITYCLEIHRSTGKVILRQAGSNAIYNYQEIFCEFQNKKELDLTKLEYVNVTADTKNVTVRNLIVCFEKQAELHPTFDKNFKKVAPVLTSTAGGGHTHAGSSLKRCPDNVNCLVQYANDQSGKEHNSKFSHPCRFSELCRSKEPYLTHDPHLSPPCRDGTKCKKLGDPYHRAEYRHKDLPDFLIPCGDRKCSNKSDDHLIRYSHGESVYQNKGAAAGSSSGDSRPPCKYGSECRTIDDAEHRSKFLHK